MTEDYIIDKRQTIIDNFYSFQGFIFIAERFFSNGSIEAGAVFTQMAAHYAWLNHPGVFCSGKLEKLLAQIAEKLKAGSQAICFPSRSSFGVRKVMHVLTQAYSTGGHTRLAWRWIKSDSSRIHSLVLTRQGSIKVPGKLVSAVESSGGSIYMLDRRRGGLTARALALHSLIRSYDAILLHIHPYDVIPMLALRDCETRPKVIFVNHADHVFWQGVRIADLVCNIRESSKLLCINRRNIPEERCALLPIPIVEYERDLSKQEARQKLGIPGNAIVLVSIASAYKYKVKSKSPDLSPFLCTLLPILNKYKNCYLLIIGPEKEDEAFKHPTGPGKRIRCYGLQEDIKCFLDAADIYLDSFPISSLTSLLEAGARGLPLLSLCNYTGLHSLLCADGPGLTGTLLSTCDAESYRQYLANLIEDKELRERLGKETKEKIINVHKRNWMNFVEEAYKIACSLPQQQTAKDGWDEVSFSDLDLALASIEGKEVGEKDVIQSHYRLLPISKRYEFRKEGNIYGSLIIHRLLLSESTSVRLKSILRKLHLMR
ncbi:MAG: glycosyltransferase family 4 protein [bacterium]